MDVAMQSQTNKQRHFEKMSRASGGRGMFRCMIFGAAFAVGLTFGISPGMAQGTAQDEGASDTTTSGQSPAIQESTATSSATAAIPTGDASSAVVFMYHRFAETDFPSTNIRGPQFEAHLRELSNGKYTVMGVPEIVDALQNGKGLPDYAIGITVDDAYRSVYDVAWPAFKKHNMPMTVFVAS